MQKQIRNQPVLNSKLLWLPLAMLGAIAQPSFAQSENPADLPQLSPPPSPSPPLPASEPVPESDLGESDRYLLGGGDLIQLEVFNLPDYSKQYQILSDGRLSLPLVGPVQVRGLTIEQAAAAIEAAYAQYIRSPVITLNLVTTRPVQVAIAGEVNRPGAYTVPAELNAITVTQALQLAGGITQSADVRQVQVLRPQPNGASPQIYTVSLWQLLKDGDLSQDLKLTDGDRVLVPEAIALNSEEITQLATASFSPETITVYVVGEVETPGAVELAPNTPLNQGLLAAGGFTNRAARGEVSLVRLNPNGTVAQEAVEIDFSENLDSAVNPPLREGDTIVVQRSGLAQTSDFAGLLLSPLRGVLGLFNSIFD
ncbi:MAG: SLBB domain-containing protein [Phormidesmis sp.]